MIKRQLKNPLFLLLAGAAGVVFAACSSSGQSSDMYTTLSKQPKGSNSAKASPPPAPAPATTNVNPALNNGYEGTPPPNITDVEPGAGYFMPPPPHGVHVNTGNVHVNVDTADHRMHIRVPFVDIDLNNY